MGCVSWSKGAEEPNWTITLEEPMLALAGAIVEGRIYVVTAQGQLLAIGNGQGREQVYEAPAYGSAAAQAAGASEATNGHTTSPETLTAFFDIGYGEFLLRDPEQITELGFSEAFGLEDRDLTDVSLAYQLETIGLAREQLAALHEWDYEALDPEEQVSYAIYEWYLQDWIESEPYVLYAYPDNHIFGWHTNWVNFMLNGHPLETFDNIKSYYLRLGQFNNKADQMIDFLEARRAAGIVPPRAMVATVLEQLRPYAETPIEEHILFTHFREAVEPMSAFTDQQKSKFYQNAASQMSQGTMVGFRKLVQYYERLLAEADTDHGFSAHPGGADAYQYWLSYHTTTDLTPDEVHAIGLQEVERITAAMEEAFTELGVSGENLNEKMAEVGALSGLVFGNEEVVAVYEEIYANAPADFAGYFDTWPEYDLVVIPFSSETAPGGYYVHPTPDGSRPGAFYVNIVNGQYRANMTTLAYHEGVPGHHYQIALQYALEGLPNFRNGVSFTAFSEGWALYAESLAVEAGVYEDDPYGYLGYLQAELFRAARLVVDTGLHAQGWSREEAIDYMVRTVGFSQAAMITEVDRYLVWPGQAAAYKIGMLKIQELRQRAEESLGESFDLIAFHNELVSNGSIPLDILEMVVDLWIEDQAARP
jgi:uncharacterized protein (DUF885 family)